MNDVFNFNISLSVLNHLGRNLYRNVITVIGEAISNSWDADAKNVWISIDKDNNNMIIEDDGLGMNREDFANKFLMIGYSKRDENGYKTLSGRPYIGRKGIGKLALLSCAEKIKIVTKTNESDILGGVIDNKDLDKAIENQVASSNYTLGDINSVGGENKLKSQHGTKIEFISLIDNIFNTPDYLRRLIALHFKFSLIDPSFRIHVNDREVNFEDLKFLSSNTQFIWTINDINDPFIKEMGNLVSIHKLKRGFNFKGYLATVNKPSELKIRGSKEKVGVDLFVNGRLRERDIMRHINTSRIVENYVYGQIHFDELDSVSTEDAFTSNREGVKPSNESFKSMLAELDSVFREIIDDWDDLRRNIGKTGDPENTKKITPRQRVAEELYYKSISEVYEPTKKSIVNDWVIKLSKEAVFNIPSYTDCFISENLLREYIKYKSIDIKDEFVKKIDKYKENEVRSKGQASISFEIRKKPSLLYYLDMLSLAQIIEEKNDDPNTPSLRKSTKRYKPVRNAVAHTSIITDVAKRHLNVEYKNIKARVTELIKEL